MKDMLHPLCRFFSASLLLTVCHFASQAQGYSIDQNGIWDPDYSAPYEVTIVEDGYSDEIFLDFDFEFFGNTYSSLWMGQDGFLTFDGPTGTTWDPQTIPDPTDPNNLIAGVWMDLDNYECMYGGCYTYETIGSAPNRRFVASWYVYSYCGNYVETQIKLFESSNIIEIHTYYEAFIIGLQGGGGGGNVCDATQGIENSDGTAAYFLPDRNNNSGWQAPDDYVAFIPTYPDDAGILANVTTYCTGSADIATIIRNYGSNTIDSVIVNWSWNGVVQTPIDVMFQLLPGQNASVTLGTQTLTFGDTDTLIAWTSMPNGVSDSNPSNDVQGSHINPGLQGTFTIGGTDPDFASIQDALDTLNTYGICDSVILNIRPGTYNEQLEIGYISGAFGDNLIFFRSESGDSSDVIIEFTASSFSTNFVIQLSGARNIVLEHLTLRALGSTYARVLDILFSASENTIRHCELQGNPTPSSSYLQTVIYSEGLNQGNVISHNKILNGSNSFYQYSDEDYGGYPDGIVLEHNEMAGFRVNGIYSENTRGLSVHHNDFISGHSNARAVEIYTDFEALQVYNNHIVLDQGLIGMMIAYCNYPESEVLAYNNTISLGGTSGNARGMWVVECNAAGIYFNSSHVTNTASTSRALDMNSGTATEFRNNIFVNTGGGYAIQANNTGGISCDNNNLFATGPYLVRFGSVNVTDLAEWTMLSGFDSTSLSVVPLFTSDTDLHTIQPQFNKRGTPISAITFDMDDEPRDTLLPDLGADEFVPLGNDIGVVAFVSPVDTCLNEQEVRVLVQNFGSNQVTQYTLQWELDGISQTPIEITQGIDTLGGIGDHTAHTVLDTIILSDDQEVSLKAWTAMPNEVGDALPENDTSLLLYRMPLQGIYTIGGSSPDFNTMGEAVATMEEFSICGPVTFRFRDGVYSEQVVIDTIIGSSEINTITFESESGDSSLVELTASGLNSSANYVIYVDRADHLIFRNLRFNSSNNPVYTAILYFDQTSSHITLEGNTFYGKLNSTVGNLVFKNSGAESSYFKIQNNTFHNGTSGIHINGMNFPNRAEGLIVTGNTFRNQRTIGIRATNQDSCVIRHNLAFKDVTNVVSYTGFDLDNLSNNGEINQNTITLQTGGNGLDVNGANNFVGDNGKTRISNNMIYTPDGIGLRIWNSVRPAIHYNNVSTGGPDAIDHAFELVSGDSIDIRNNNFIANNGRAVSNTFVAPMTVICDYNNLLTAGAEIGYWDGVSYTDLPAWQTGTMFDSSSMSVDPLFLSTTDLHVLADTLDGAGTPIPGISVDFDGQPRNATMPDIGADEIGANANDAGIFALLPEMPFARGNQDIKAVVRNFGSNTISSVDIQWTLDEVTQTTYAYTGTLESLQQDTITIGNLDFSLATPYNLKAWTENPNSVADLYNHNDTLSAMDRYAAVSDTVTVGGTDPDVTSIDSAIVALMLGGVLDSVHFQIRPDTYTGLIEIQQNDMLQCGSVVIFESASGNPADVVLVNTGLTTSTLVLDGADGLTFRNLTIRNTEAATHAIEVKNEANCNTFDGCIIEGIETTSTSNTRATVFSGGSTDTANVFTNNIIRHGSYGVYWYGSADERGNVFSGNTIENAYYIGFYTRYQEAPVISENTFTTNSTRSDVTGFYLYNVDLDYQLTGNQVLLSDRRSTAFYLVACAGSASQRSLVANNYIRTGNHLSGTGIYLYTSSYCDIFHNTVKMEGSHTSSAAFYEYGSIASNLDIRNNVFYTTSGGTAMHFSHAFGLDASDFNCLYTTGSVLCKVSSSNYTDLAEWQGAGQDANSLSEDPLFVSESDYQPTSAALNESGTPLTIVTTDIEGEPRDLVMPDMGCDEFSIFTDDVGLVAINYPTQPYPSGINTIFIKFVNNGLDTLTSMQVDWEVDGVPQPTYQWTGLLPSAGTYDSLDVGTFDFAPYAGHAIKVWVSLPNGQPDGLSTNDTLLVTDLYPGLLGDYTIGGMDPDFISITEAVDALQNGGAAGPVTFHLRTGTYLETISLNAFPGCGCDTPVTFTSEASDSSAVTITNLGIDDHTVTLDGADGVIFEDLTIESVNPTFRRVIAFFNGAHCNQFHRNTLRALETTSSNSNFAVVWSASNSGDSANVFTHNTLLRGSYGFYLDGSGTVDSRTVIEDNTLQGTYYRGIYADRENGIQVRRNTILPAGYSAFDGIYLTNCELDVEVSGNNVEMPFGSYGIYMSGGDASEGQPGRILNNFVSLAGTGTAYALYLNASSHYEILHNNTHVYSSTGSSTNNAALVVNSCEEVVLRNNIAYSQSPGYAVYVHGTTGFDSDYNDFAGGGANLGYYSGATQINLATWQSASGGDANSVSVNPQYMSNVDLHVSNAVLDSAGVDAGVLVDIDGENRSAPPDIGADEFTPAANDDAGIFAFNGPIVPFAHGSQPVEVTLKNFGGNTLTSVNVRWLVNGIEQPVFAWTGSVGAGGCDTIAIGNFNFSEYTAHDFIMWTEMPNGIPDSTHVNDTLYFNDLYPALSGTYTVGGVLPDFNLFSQVQNALNKGGILGDVAFDIRNGTYVSQLNILGYPGMSPDYTVTLRSESGDSSAVTILRDFNTLSGDNYTVRLRNAGYINFERITFKSTKGRVVEIDQEAGHITFTHCRFQGIPFPSNSGSTQLVYSPTSTEDSLLFSNNRFEYGSYGILMTASSGARESGLRILNNEFINNDWRPLSVSYQTGVTIDGNVVLNDTERGNAGMYVTYCNATVSVSGNQIISTVGHPYGLYLYAVTGTSESPAMLANNYIYTTGGTSTVHGIYQAYGEYNNFYHNSVRIENTHAESRAFTDDSSYDNIEILNCILSNSGGGKAIHNNWAVGSHTNVMDYCNLYTTGPVLAYWFNPMADLTEIQTETNTNLNSTDAEPLFTDGTFKVYQSALEDAGTPLLSVTNDIEGDVRSGSDPDIGCDEFTLLSNDIGVKSLVSPQTYCGLGSVEEITLRIQNFGSTMQTGFDVAYSLDGSAWHVEDVGALEVEPGQSVDYTFGTTEDLSVVGDYTFAIHTHLTGDEHTANDTLWGIEVEHIPALTSPVGNMVPTDGTMNLNKPVSLSWTPAPNATRYDVYIWEDGTSQPATPQINNIAQINTSYSQVEYGTTYNWQVVAENVCDVMVPGPVQQFTVRLLPDLVVDTVVAPLSAFSGQPIEVEWITRNLGPGGTQSTTWSDAVYLSLDATLNTSFDIYLGAVQNLTALDSGVSYAHEALVTLPIDVVGNYYLFVHTDRYNNLVEATNNNNWERSQVLTTITLTPAPDLDVSEVTAPIVAFSGETINVLYTVENKGTGSTGNMQWHDRIYLSTNPFDPGNFALGTFPYVGEVLPDSTYTRNLEVVLPEGISGDHFVFVHTDALNVVYEFSAENNNRQSSDTMEVILSPPADLVMTDVIIPDTISSDTKLWVNWTVENQGAGATEADYWRDDIFLSPAPVYNDNFNKRITYAYHAETVPSLGVYQAGALGTFPKFVQGYYYLFGNTDIAENEYEYNMEENNVYAAPAQVFLVNPDLIVSNLVHADTVDGAVSFEMEWDQQNAGLGRYDNKYIQTRIYASTEAEFNENTAQLIVTDNSANQNMPGGTSIPKSRFAIVPPQLFGDLYLHVRVDATNTVYEGNQENNNIVTSQVHVMEAAPSDIHVTSISVPDTATAGFNISVSYNTTNTGEVVTMTDWHDDVYISFDSVWMPENATKLRDISQNTPVVPGDTIETNTYLSLSAATTENVYYIYVVSDEQNHLYESTGESNNISRSMGFYVKAVPQVDLTIDTLELAQDTLMSGAQYPVTWTTSITNGGTPVIGSWNDRAYLSTDLTLDTLLDTQVGIYVVDGVINQFGPDNPVTAQGNVVIPNGMSGQYYLILVSDFNEVHNDPNRTNNREYVRAGNGSPRLITIALSPSPDLIMTSLVAPPDGIGGQLITLEYCVANEGTRSAAGTWRDQIYLSTDNMINVGDLLLVESEHQFLDTAASYCDTMTALIPVSYSGNYVIIAQTDQGKQIYEHASEHNNELQRSIEVTLPPPSDLEVTTVTIPLNAVAGNLVDISWETKNIGNYPASGQFRELVYLSADTTWDVNDPVFGVVDQVGYIPPMGTQMSTLQAPVKDVVIGDYHAIIQTDARNNFSESDEDNNYTTSVDRMHVDVKTLILDSLTVDTLVNGRELYYKINVPPSLEGETMVISLEGDSLNGINELFARFTDIPTRGEFDFGFDLPFSGFQRLIIPSLQTGTYYILGYGVATQDTAQEVELLARIVPFEIFSISPMKGVTDTRVTVEIKGVKLSNTEKYRLRQNDPWFELIAESVFEFSENLIYATFDLTDVPVDTYSLDGVKVDSSLAFMEDGFLVVENGAADLQVRATAPSTLPRRLVPVKIEVRFINTGDVDVEGAIVQVDAPYGNLIAPTLDQLRMGQGESILRVPIQEVNGPPGILRPGGSGIIEVYAWSHPGPSFVVGLKD